MRGIFNKLAITLAMATSLGAHAATTTTEVLSYNYGNYTFFGEFNSDAYTANVASRLVNNFFVFDLTGVNLQNIESAHLWVDNNYAELRPGYSMTYTMYDVVTPLNVLMESGTSKFSVFKDLQQGVKYGSRTLNNLDGFDTDFTVDFDATGIAAISNANGLWAFGGALVTNDPSNQAMMFGDVYTAKLVLNYSAVTTPVPEADSSAMILAGLGLMGFISRRRYK